MHPILRKQLIFISVISACCGFFLWHRRDGYILETLNGMNDSYIATVLFVLVLYRAVVCTVDVLFRMFVLKSDVINEFLDKYIFLNLRDLTFGVYVEGFLKRLNWNLSERLTTALVDDLQSVVRGRKMAPMSYHLKIFAWSLIALVWQLRNLFTELHFILHTELGDQVYTCVPLISIVYTIGFVVQHCFYIFARGSFYATAKNKVEFTTWIVDLISSAFWFAFTFRNILNSRTLMSRLRRCIGLVEPARVVWDVLNRFWRKRTAEKMLLKLQEATADDLERDDTCMVCLEVMAVEPRSRVLPCGHVCHIDCLKGWVEERESICPLCRHDLSEFVLKDPPEEELPVDL